tara:strand:- start:456 stop:728 length:273 start_codon:yes stop_codon:yes gene_type:complete
MTNDEAIIERVKNLLKNDNAEVLEEVCSRLEMGVETYGHGFRIGDDTRQFGTREDTWVEMGLEEAIDLSLYLVAELLRMKREIRERQEKV